MRLKSRMVGRQHEFIHNLSKILTDDYEGDIVITIDPDRIVKDLMAHCNTEAEYTPVKEGILGMSPGDPRKKAGYTARIIGYKFKKTKQ